LLAFIEGMKISESQHFTFYGTAFNSNIQQESREFFEKKFICNLRQLDISRGEFICNENIRDIKVSVNNNLQYLFNNTQLESLALENSTLNNNFLYMLVDSLQSENGLKMLNLENCRLNGESIKILMGAFEANPHLHIEKLNLARDNIGFIGVEFLSKMLKENKTIRVLNLYKNYFDVNGARRLAEALELNSTVESLDIGFNRIKNQGFNCIMNSLLKNEKTNVAYLGLRYNHIEYVSITDNLKKLSTNLTNKLKSIELENNDLKDFEINELYNKVYKGSTYHLDLFEGIYFLNPERLERTVWISPIPHNVTKQTICKSLISKETSNNFIGIPYSILIRKSGRKTKKDDTVDAFVEFLLPSSVYKLL
jgi:Ran GTPase-activating protein (RanGAP) involved in mRNA processing and transport